MFHPDGPTFMELARQALSSTQRGYDLLATKFDYTPFRTDDLLLEAVPRFLGEPLDAALDLCCGTGAAMRMLRPHCRQVVGIDFSQGMLRVCREQLAGTEGAASTELVRGDVLQMPFRPAFDVAVCFGALGHILPRDQARFVEQVAGALRTGGRFLFATSRMPDRWTRCYWQSRAFNAAMHVRNALIKPPFIMYYLTFLLPEATRLLASRGFAVDVQDHVFPAPFQQASLVIATKTGGTC